MPTPSLLRGLGPAAALVLLGGALVLWAGPARPDRHLELPRADGSSVRVLLFGSPGSGPPVLVVHSVFQAEETVYPLAAELARQGVVAAVVPMAGPERGFPEYVADLGIAARALAPGTPSVLGHSMGVELAMAWAADADPPAVVAVGFAPEATPEEPANLLLSAGVWDELHPFPEMRAALERAATGRDEPEPGARARRLLLLPLSNHVLENTDPMLAVEAPSWVRRAAGLDPRPAFPRVLWLPASRGLLEVGLALLLAGLGAALLRRRPGASRLLLAFAALAAGLASLLPQDPPLPAASRLAFLIFLGAAAAAGLDPEDGLECLQRRGAALAAVALLALGAGQAATALPALLDSPARGLALPVELLLAALVQVDVAVAGAARALLLRPEALAGVPVVLVALTGLELARPGTMARFLGLLPLRLARAARSLRPEPVRRPSLAEAALLAGLALVALGAWRQVAAAGYVVEGEDARRLAGLAFRMLGVPLAVALLLLRWPWVGRALD